MRSSSQYTFQTLQRNARQLRPSPRTRDVDSLARKAQSLLVCCGNSLSQYLLGYRPFGRGLRCYLWINKHREAACSLSCMEVGDLIAAFSTPKGRGPQWLSTFGYLWLSPNKHWSPLISGSHGLTHAHTCPPAKPKLQQLALCNSGKSKSAGKNLFQLKNWNFYLSLNYSIWSVRDLEHLPLVPGAVGRRWQGATQPRLQCQCKDLTLVLNTSRINSISLFPWMRH